MLLRALLPTLEIVIKIYQVVMVRYFGVKVSMRHCFLIYVKYTNTLMVFEMMQAVTSEAITFIRKLEFVAQQMWFVFMFGMK